VTSEEWSTKRLASAILDICADAFAVYGHCLYTWEVATKGTPEEEAADAAPKLTGWDEHQDDEGRMFYRVASSDLARECEDA
jgi:hypothetical protein